MMNYHKQLLLFLALVLCTSAGVLNAQTWKPAVLYLENLPVTRIGTDSDAAIISDLKADGYFVLEVDCSGFPSTSPELENAIMEYYRSTCDILKSYDSTELDVDQWMVYLVPEGYRIKRDIPVWNIKDNGADGSVDYIMKTYNEDIVPKYGDEYNLVEVTDPDDMRDRAGNPIDYNLRMDIVYPSGNVSNPVPLIMDHASVSPRLIPFSPCNTGQQFWTTIFPAGFLTSGYAWSLIDHCYNPLARKEVWDNISRFTLDNWDGLASSTAFVRYVKSHLAEYNLNGKIGSMGISKASYSALRLSNKNNANEAEYSLFNGKANDKPQPWPGAESTIDVAYIAAGHGTRRMPQYADSNSVPIITSAGANDPYDKWNEFPEVVKYMQNSDLNFLPLWMEDMGHNYPSMGTDLATGQGRYSLFKKYFDHYLKTIVIAEGLQNSTGQTLPAEFVREFKVSSSEDKEETDDLKIPTTDDTFSLRSKKNSPEGSALNMRVRHSQYAEYDFDGYLKFSIKDLQAEDIQNAKITLTTGSTLTGEPITVNLYKTTTEWQESTLDSENLPTYDDAPTDQNLFKGDGNDSYVEFDVSTALKNAIAIDEESISFALRATSGNKENIYFNTKEVENEKLRPYLVVEEIVLGLQSNTDQKVNAYYDNKNKLLTFTGLKPADLSVYDITGRLTLSKIDLEQNAKVNLSHLKSGIYILLFTIEDKPATMKIIL